MLVALFQTMNKQPTLEISIISTAKRATCKVASVCREGQEVAMAVLRQEILAVW